MVTQTYADENDIGVGDKVAVGERNLDVVGLVKAPLGGDASDIYMQLATLQTLSDRKGRVNTLEVRANDVDAVDATAKRIEDEFSGSQVTTAKDLSDRVSGSLVSAQNLSDKLGDRARDRRPGGRLPDRQPAHAGLGQQAHPRARHAEGDRLAAVARGAPGERRVARPGRARWRGRGGDRARRRGSGRRARHLAEGERRHRGHGRLHRRPGRGGPLGDQVTAGSSTVTLGAPVDAQLLALAIGLALLGGLIAGAVGGIRAGRLRPAEALRSVE